MSKRAVERLSRLLDMEKAALICGDLEAVAALVPEKEALTAEFEGASTTELRLLSAALLRNGELLTAAKEGVSTVLTMLSQQRAARMSLSSYDSNGKATEIGQPVRGTERRF